MKVSKDTPLAEITLRKYEKPRNLKERDAIKKVCLSIGLLQPGDSRDIIVDVLQVFLVSKNKREHITIPELEGRVKKNREKYKLEQNGVASSNIRRQVKRLKDMLIIEKVKKSYRIVEFNELEEIFTERIEKFILKSTIDRVKEHLSLVNKKTKIEKIQ